MDDQDQVVETTPVEEPKLNEYPTSKEVFAAIRENKRFVMGTDIDRMFLISDAVKELLYNKYGTDHSLTLRSMAHYVEKLDLERLMRREKIERLKEEVISTARGL